MLAFGVGLSGRMEEIQEHVPGRRDLRKQQLHRVRWTLPRRLQGQLAQPFRKRLPVAPSGGFDLAELLWRESGRYRFGAEARANFIVGWRWRMRRSRDARSGQKGGPPQKQSASDNEISQPMKTALAGQVL
jgi:hypothetical protein